MIYFEKEISSSMFRDKNQFAGKIAHLIRKAFSKIISDIILPTKNAWTFFTRVKFSTPSAGLL